MINANQLGRPLRPFDLFSCQANFIFRLNNSCLQLLNDQPLLIDVRLTNQSLCVRIGFQILKVLEQLTRHLQLCPQQLDATAFACQFISLGFGVLQSQAGCLTLKLTEPLHHEVDE